MRRWSDWRGFIGPEASRAFDATVGLSLAVFAVEASFVYVLQGFLGSLGVVEPDAVRLPDWYPRGFSASILALVVFGFLRAVVFTALDFQTNLLSQLFNERQRRRIVERCLRDPARVSVGRAVADFSDTVTRAGNALGFANTVATRGLCAAFYVALGLAYAPREMALGSALLVLLALPLRLLNRQVHAAGDALSERWAEVSDALVHGIRHNFYLRVYGLVESERAKAADALAGYLANYRRFQAVASWRAYAPMFFGILVIGAVTWVGKTRFDTPGAVLLSFFYIFLRMAQSLSEAVGAAARYQGAARALSDVRAWEDAAPAEAPRPAPAAEPARLALRRSIAEEGVRFRAEGLSFRYQGDAAPVLKGLSFLVGRGDVLLVTGESGSGKSTLLSLLLGLLEPSGGELSVNGVGVLTARDELPAFVGYAGSEPYLVRGTVRENLLYGHPRPDAVGLAEFDDALRRARADGFVAALPDGDRTLLHEAAQLSTGQRQRLAIARMLLRKPRLLVLDEFTSNLDRGTEREVLAELAQSFPAMTTVIVSHRPGAEEFATCHIRL